MPIQDNIPKDFTAPTITSLATTHDGVFALLDEGRNIILIEAAKGSVRDALLALERSGRATDAKYFIQMWRGIQYPEGAATELRNEFYAQSKRLPKLNAI